MGRSTLSTSVSPVPGKPLLKSRVNPPEPKDSLVCLMHWAGMPPSGYPLLALGWKLPRTFGSCPPSLGTHFDFDLLLHLFTLHGRVFLLEPAKVKADMVTIAPPGTPFPPAPWLLVLTSSSS